MRPEAAWFAMVYFSVVSLYATYGMITNLSWHSGTSVLANTINHACGDLLDTSIVVMVLLIGFGCFGYAVFGAMAGSYDFRTFNMAFNTMARLSFGLIDYKDYRWIRTRI